MGRGDKKTKKGKTFKGSYGKSRPARVKKAAAAKKKQEIEFLILRFRDFVICLYSKSPINIQFPKSQNPEISMGV